MESSTLPADVSAPGAPRDFEPVYLRFPRDDREVRVARALATLSECRICPRRCGVDRQQGDTGICRIARYAVVESWGPHRGEERCLRGSGGSGTLFFSGCNLRCVFCQNFDISQGIRPSPDGGEQPETLAGIMLDLQRQGCHNINLVSPGHLVPQLVEALSMAIDAGLRLPVVYNTSGYDAPEALELMDGLVDIYMPDFKFWSPGLAERYTMAPEYPEVTRNALREMHRQVGPLSVGDDGLARRGLLIRHLVMPGQLDETRAILTWIAEELGRDSYVNLMDQYFPAGRVGAADPRRPSRFPELNRVLEGNEFEEALAVARGVGLTRVDGRN